MPCSTIVLHGTGGHSAQSSADWLEHIGLSYHYIINRDGSVLKCVPYKSRYAYHAGKSVGPNGSDVNKYSVGISFANMEDGIEQITIKQIESAIKIINDVCADMKGIKYITRHKDISPGRKYDPKTLSYKALVHIAGMTGLQAWRAA